MRPLINNTFLLEKFYGKGGWTYTILPPIPKDEKNNARSVRVMGTIDSYAIKQYHLMPMADGRMMLPVKAEIRKHIKKQAGDKVQVTLYQDNTVLEVPDELLMCLQDEPGALKFFNSITENQRKYYVQWICAAKGADTKANRIAKTINRLAMGLKMYDV